MMTIIQLDEETINKIAAGEVVERPANVAKELIENALDAGATKIYIDIMNGGVDKIIVEDNGCGMTRDDAERCIMRHATSKIKDHHDLFNISTMGFRGEALSSIAAVSRLKITTKHKDDNKASKIIADGKDIRQEVTASNQGTRVVVENIFYNVPARAKFLKAKSTEQKMIADIVTRYALIYEDVAFALKADGNLLLDKPVTNSVKENMLAIYGIDVARESFEIKDEIVEGFVAKPTINRSTRDYISVYVNKRYVKSKIIENALMDALKTLIFHGRYPIAILNIKTGPQNIDVNVHPSKKIVKFDDEELIYKKVFHAVKNAMHHSDLFAETQIKHSQAFLKEPMHEEINEEMQKKEQGYAAEEDKIGQKDKSKYFESANEQQSHLIKEAEGRYSPEAVNDEINIIGQVHKTYILIETKEGYSIIDQHAAEERINYEKIKKQFENRQISRQALLQAENIELTATEKTTIDSNKEMLYDFGFIFDDFGTKSIIIREIPSTISLEHDIKQTLLTVAEKINQRRNIETDEKIEAAIKYMACRGSIKAGKRLTMEQMKKLVKGLMDTDRRYTCPHGRPSMIRFPLSKIEKDFKRIE